MAVPTGMVFILDRFGNPTPTTSGANPGSPPNDSPPVGDFVLVVTGVPAGVNFPAVQALLTSFCVLPIPYTLGGIAAPIRFRIAYSAILATIVTTATIW